MVLILRIVGPGAEILLKSIEPFDPETTPSMLTPAQWAKLADAFHSWHFKPDVLEDESFVNVDVVDDFKATARWVEDLSDESILSLAEHQEREGFQGGIDETEDSEQELSEEDEVKI